MKGVANYKLPSDHVRFPGERRPKAAMLLLYQIRSELNPQEFTAQEVREEFGALSLEREGDIPVDRDEALALLIGRGFIERLRPGVYRVTEAGMQEPDPQWSSVY